MAAAQDSNPILVDPPGLRSQHSYQTTYCVFVNESPIQVHLQWIDFTGSLKSYGYIEPGERRTQHTFLTHPWTFRCTEPGILIVDDQDRIVVFPSAWAGPAGTSPNVVRLRPARYIEWTPAEHRRWGHVFKTKVRTLLLCVARERQRRAARQRAQTNPLRRSLRLAARISPAGPPGDAPATGNTDAREAPARRSKRLACKRAAADLADDACDRATRRRRNPPSDDPRRYSRAGPSLLRQLASQVDSDDDPDAGASSDNDSCCAAVCCWPRSDPRSTARSVDAPGSTAPATVDPEPLATRLAALPTDILLEIVKHMAPPLPVVAAVPALEDVPGARLLAPVHVAPPADLD